MIKKETDKNEKTTKIIVYIVLSEFFFHIYSQSFIEMIEKESRIRLFCTDFNKNDIGQTILFKATKLSIK